MWTTLIGGIGLFLLGMILMTDGLKAMAGEALERVLSRFVSGKFSALASGAVVTALVQSSSVTTLTTIGFVSAGLITFSQAVGVIFGSNLGTTSTGWVVSQLGFKLSLGAIALPLIGLGALAKLLFKRKLSAGGTALAGFGLIFVGIDTMAAGMEGLADVFDPSALPSDALWGRVLLALMGAAMTVVMQSSSAAVATTLTALHSGTIGLEQAAVLVIGQNVGTTVKAGVAAIGASVAARRTAVAHVLFNGATGLIAFLALPQFVRAASWMAGYESVEDGATTLAAFHTLFNVLGVLLFLPILGRFASWVERLVPERGSQLVRHLDPSVAMVGPVAVQALRRTLVGVAQALLALQRERLEGGGQRRGARGPGEPPPVTREEIEHALREANRFASALGHSGTTRDEQGRLLACLHAIDHLERLTQALGEEAPAGAVSRAAEVKDAALELARAHGEVTAELARIEAPDAHTRDRTAAEARAVELASDASIRAANQRRLRRAAILELTASGAVTPQATSHELEAMRWVDRIGYHTWRALHHLRDQPAAGDDATDAEPAAP